MYCVKCGKEVHDQAIICPYCGCATGNPFPNQQQQQRSVNPNDAPSFGYAVLGFFLPIVGLILYLIWKQEYPMRSKSAGKGALVAVIIEGLLLFIVVAFYFIVFFIAVLASTPELSTLIMAL